jgi:hypothetical protein
VTVSSDDPVFPDMNMHRFDPFHTPTTTTADSTPDTHPSGVFSVVGPTWSLGTCMEPFHGLKPAIKPYIIFLHMQPARTRCVDSVHASTHEHWNAWRRGLKTDIKAVNHSTAAVYDALDDAAVTQ